MGKGLFHLTRRCRLTVYPKEKKKRKKNPGEELNNRYYITPISHDAVSILLRTTGDVEWHRVLLVAGALEADAETIDVLGTDKLVVDGPRVLSEAVVDGCRWWLAFVRMGEWSWIS